MRSAISANDVYRAAQEINGEGPLEVAMTGSELLIGCEDFCTLSNRLIVDLSARVGVITSAYWARSERSRTRGLMYLSECGVSSVRLSIDAFHGELAEYGWLSDLVLGLRSRSIESFVNEAVPLGAAPKFQEHVTRAGIPAKHYMAFTASRAGRMREKIDLKIGIPDSKFNTSYLDCDFGTVMYLHSNREVYGCSGPGNATARKLCDADSLHAWRERIPILKNKIDEIRFKHPSSKCDTCRECNNLFYQDV